MRHLLLSTVAAAAMLAAPLAYADTSVVVVYDGKLTEQMAAERSIVDTVRETFGESAVYDNRDGTPEDVDQALTPGQMLAPDLKTGPVPDKLAGKLPHTAEGTHWVAVGEHLVEVAPDNTIVMTVYDVLP